MSDHLRCAALLRSGERCRSVAVERSEFCGPHRDPVAENGEEALRRGEYPRRRRDSALVRAQPGEDLPLVETSTNRHTGTGNTNDTTARPSDVRPRLAEAAAANLSELERVLVETATGANRRVWTTITCKHCERQGRYEVDVPDNRVRLDAVEKLLQQGLGRAREAEQSAGPQLPDDPAAVERMSWQDQQRLAEVFFAEEIAAIARDGGEALVRERVSALSDQGRRLLRDALAAA